MMLNVIESVQNKIRDFRPTYEKSEAMVCVQLIEPVLIGLGWDIQNDSDSIVKNAKAEGGIPDYTLKLEGKPCLYIEAKKLGTHLNPSNRGDTPLHQLSKYCSDNGVDYGLLTDGEKWLLFLLPNVLGFLMFTAFPVAFSLVLSFCAWDLLTWPPRFEPS